MFFSNFTIRQSIPPGQTQLLFIALACRLLSPDAFLPLYLLSIQSAAFFLFFTEKNINQIQSRCILLWLGNPEATVCSDCTEGKTMVRPLPGSHYCSQNMSKNCQPFVIELFINYIIFSWFWETTAYSAHTNLHCFESPKNQDLPCPGAQRPWEKPTMLWPPQCSEFLQPAPTSKWNKWICYLKISATCQARNY